MVPVDRTEEINPYMLGTQATADTCEVNEIKCIYDESLSNSGNNPRFFEPGSTQAFFLTKEPQDVENWENTNYVGSGSDVIKNNMVFIIFVKVDSSEYRGQFHEWEVPHIDHL